MPTYQYACTACGHELEAVQSFADDPLTECPTCEGRLRKVFASVGIVFKGSGFYRTDSRSEASAGKAKSESPTNGKSESPANGSATESKSTSDSSGVKTKSDAKTPTVAGTGS